MDEEQLIGRAAAGDSEAFGSLVKPYLGLFFNGIQRILGNRADAQDALQNALLGIFQDLPGFQARSRFSSWAYRVCINAALMFRRGNPRHREDSIDDGAGLGDFDQRGHHLDSRESLRWSVEPQALAEAERRQLRECLQQALDELPEALRVVFVLRDLEDWSTEDIAARLDQSAPAVRQRLHRARVRVQQRLREHLQVPLQGRAS
jgi:RNA polymerase sigma-70 factor (ECF subfamily)